MMKPLPHQQESFAGDRRRYPSFHDPYHTDSSPENIDQPDNHSSFYQPDKNDEFCFVCKEAGDVYCCDNCHRTYHPKCLDPESQPNNSTNRWKCPACVLHQLCTYCIGEVELFGAIICSICYRYAHKECANRPGTLSKVGKATLMPLEDPFVCDGCLKCSGVKFVLDHIKIHSGSYLLVVPNKSSPIHRTWINEKSLFQLQKLKPIAHVRKQLATFEQYAVIDKIIDIRASLYYSKIPVSEWLDRISNPDTASHYGDESNFKFLVKWMHCSSIQATWEDEHVVRASPNDLRKFVQIKRMQLNQGSQENLLLCGNPKPQQKSETQKKNWTVADMYRKKQNIFICTQDALCRRMDEMVCLFNQILSSTPGQIVIFCQEQYIPMYQTTLKKYCPNEVTVVLSGLKQNQDLVKEKQMTFQRHTRPKFNVLLCTTESFQSNYMYFFSEERIKLNPVCFIFHEEAKMRDITAETLDMFSKAYKIVFIQRHPSKDNLRDIVRILDKGSMDAITSPTALNIRYAHEFKRMIKQNSNDSSHPASNDSNSRENTNSNSNSQSTKPIITNDRPANAYKESINIPNTSRPVVLGARHQPMVPQRTSKPYQKPQYNYQQQTSVPNRVTQQPILDIGLTAKILTKHDTDLQMLSSFQKILFLRYVLSFGLNFSGFDSFFKGLLKFSKNNMENSPRMKQAIKKYLAVFATGIQSSRIDPRINLYDYDSSVVIKRVLQLANLQITYETYEGYNKHLFPFKKPIYVYTNRDGEKQISRDWTEEDDLELIKNMLKYGVGQWEDIIQNFMSHNQIRGIDYILRRVGQDRKAINYSVKALYCKNLLTDRGHQLLDNLYEIHKLSSDISSKYGV